MGSRTLTKITSVCAHHLDEKMPALHRVTDDPTDARGTAREQLGQDVGAGGTTAPAFFPPFFFSFPLPFPFRFD